MENSLRNRPNVADTCLRAPSKRSSGQLTARWGPDTCLFVFSQKADAQNPLAALFCTDPDHGEGVYADSAPLGMMEAIR